MNSKATQTARTKDEVVEAVRVAEDNLRTLVERFQGGALSHGSVVLGLKEILRKLTKICNEEGLENE